jgi:leucyl/phenylalanyl-tRNA--protein transferase
MVLLPAEFRLARSLRQAIRRFLRTPGAEIRIDSDCRAVLEACAASPRGEDAGTWIVPELIEAYAAWHRAGRVHSVETRLHGELVGGLYGVSIGRMFFGESMFQRRTDASKIALAYLVAFCRREGIATIDCQQQTRHLASFGGREIPRDDFRARLGEALGHADIRRWSYDSADWRRIGVDGPVDGAMEPGTDEPS